MNGFAVAKLKADHYFPASVFLDDDYIILTPDTPVTEDLIRILRAFRYEAVFTDGEQVEKSLESQEETEAEEDASAELEMSSDYIQKNILALYLSIIGYVESLFSSITSKNSFDVALLTQKVKDIIEALSKDKDELLGAMVIAPPLENYLITHSINTCLLSVSI